MVSRQSNSRDPVRIASGDADYDRRNAARYTAICRAFELGWLEHGGTSKEHCIGIIEDISMGGALLLVERVPPAGAGLWMRLADNAQEEWTEIEGLEAIRDSTGAFRLRVSFPGGCPYDLFKTVVWGEHTFPSETSLVTPDDAHDSCCVTVPTENS